MGAKRAMVARMGAVGVDVAVRVGVELANGVFVGLRVTVA